MELGKNIKLVIFDFDGTLFHLDIDWEDIKRKLRVKEGEKIGTVIQQLHTAQDPRLEALTQAEMNAVEGRNLHPDINAELSRLIAAGKHVAVLTRNTRKAVELALGGTELADKVYIVGREDVRQLKPDPEGILFLARHFGVSPAEVTLVGDTYHDVEAARAAGVHSVVVKNHKLQYAPEGADHYIKKIADLSAVIR